MRLIINIIFVFIFFIGCSSKQYFEPKQVISSYGSSSHIMPQQIKSLNKNGATLKDNRILTKDGVSKYKLPDGFRFINKIENVVIAVNNSKQLLLKNKQNIFTFDQNIIAGALKHNNLALIFEDNTVAVFDISSKKFKFKKHQKSSIINDHRIANPIFLDNIILFPTLNGNIVIVSDKTFTSIKTITIDPDNQINNVMFLKAINETMVASTTNKILSLGDGTFAVKDYTIKDIISHGKYIYVATLDGKIIKLDLSLNIIATKKLKFANIHSLGFGTKLYALESQGFLIEFNDDLTTTKVYEFDFDNTQKALSIDDTLYFDNDYIKLR